MKHDIINKIRETHNQKVLVELFNLLYNPFNLPTKNYNPIKTMIETNTIDNPPSFLIATPPLFPWPINFTPYNPI